jgi:hypothetical protein
MRNPDPGRDLIGLVGFAMLIAVIVLAVIGIVLKAKGYVP